MTFTAVNWSPNTLITNESMQQINSNMTWLKSRLPGVMFFAGNGNTSPRQENIAFMAGRMIFPKNLNVQTAQIPVYFNGYFQPNFRPVITLGAAGQWSTAGAERLHLTMRGISGAYPDATGFRFYINVNAAAAKNDKFMGPVEAHWMAMGIRISTV